MKSAPNHRLEALDRHTLELLVKRDSDVDPSSYTDDELIDAVCEIYPNDVLSSIDFANKIGNKDTDSLSCFNKAPLYFNRTSIDLVLRDLHWCYVFWSISPTKNAEMLEQDSQASIYLNFIKKARKKEERDEIVFSVDVSFQESERNIYLPEIPSSFAVVLMERVNGKETMIATSYIYNFQEPFFLSEKKPATKPTKKSIKEKEDLNNLFFAPLVNQDGYLVVDNPVLDRYFKEYGGVNE